MTLTFEASALGWPPRVRFEAIELEGETFVYVSTDYTPSGDLAGWRYASDRREILVIND
jgi:hypothetical protein